MTYRIPNRLAVYKPPLDQKDYLSWAGQVHPLAVLVCAIGFFMRIILSGPVLNILGIDYGSEDASTLSKIHPGTYFIIASFLILLCSHRNPIEQIFRIARQHKAFFSLVVIYAIILIYWSLRGPKGVGLILDVHIVMPICAIVFSYAPKSWFRIIVYLFATLAVSNSIVGLCEAATHLRLFPFDSDWEVLKQDYFRSSALLGHPLTNASFTVVSMFTLLSLRMPVFLKAIVFLIMLSSLVAFGGRSALGFSLIGLVLLGIVHVSRTLRTTRMTVLRMIMTLLIFLIVPIVCGGMLYAVLHSGMGERLMAYNSLNDDSASVRFLVFRVFGFMTPADIFFGVDGDRITEIGYHTGVANPMSDIENPWVLMFMFLGVIMFTLWAGGLGACLWQLMSGPGASLALQLAVIEYFVISTTSNSFGRKDPVYLILAGVVVCTKRLNLMEKVKPSLPKINKPTHLKKKENTSP